MSAAPYDVSVWLFGLVAVVFVVAVVAILREVDRRDRDGWDDEDGGQQ